MPQQNHILLEQRERIIRVADTIGVNRSTARSIIARYICEGRITERPGRGANNHRVDNEMSDNCMLTLAQINQELRQRLLRKPRIHDHTVARRQSGERNRPDVIQKRHYYANWFMGQAIVSHTVFGDVCGYKIWTARSQGTAIQGKRAYRQVCGQRGRNLTLALAICPTAGLVFHSVIIGGINAQKFADFLAQTRLQLDLDEQVFFHL